MAGPIAGPGPLKSSCNAGEFAEELHGKVGLKQYYSAAMRMKNIEPVPQSGFRLAPGSVLVARANAAQNVFQQETLKVSPTRSYTLIFSPGRCTIFRNDRVQVANLDLPALTAGLIGHLSVYGEADTVGIFHQTLKTIRLVRNASDDRLWTVSDWPYEKLPEVDLGGTYPKTDDEWDVAIRWTGAATMLAVTLTVEGEQTKAVELRAGGAAVAPGSASGADWADLAARLQLEVQDLPSLGAGATVSYDAGQDQSSYRVLKVRFTGALSGREFSLTANIVNTVEASVLSYHREIGKTDGEPLVSSAQGWFAGMRLYQDRAAYFAPKAVPAAIALSEVGEYFRLNIEAGGSAAARLDKLRTQTSEEIIQLFESSHLLVFTTQGEWFAANRTLTKDEPVNYVSVSRNGVQRGVPVVEIEGRVYYVSGNERETGDAAQGQAVYSAAYDDVSTRYVSEPESLLAGHLIQDVDGGALQAKVRRNAAARWWLKDRNGRLICALVIRNQEIMAFVEWVPADGGRVLALSVDGQNQVWLTIERRGTVTHEVMEESELNLFQGAVRGQTDLAGRFSGQSGSLSIWEGRDVYARADGVIHGPLRVRAGKIDLTEPATEVVAGLWQPPVFESLPYFRLLPNEEVLMRPARLHSVTVNVIETESIAIGANGSAPQDVPLQPGTILHDRAPPPVTGPVRRSGLLGWTYGTTLTISQTRPGRLQVRDYVPEITF